MVGIWVGWVAGRWVDRWRENGWLVAEVAGRRVVQVGGGG